MKDLNEKFGDDDLGLGSIGKELDDPERGMKPGYKQEPLVHQLGKVLDSRGMPNPVEHVTTDDGKKHKVGPNMATALMALLKGQLTSMKPASREKLQDKMQSSDGLESLLGAKSKSELISKAEALVDLQDTDRPTDKSIY